MLRMAESEDSFTTEREQFFDDAWLGNDDGVVEFIETYHLRPDFRHLCQHALRNAIANDHGSVVKLLIDTGTDVNDCSGNITPLMLASYRSSNRSIKYLLADPKIDFSFKNSDGETALIIAAKFGCDEIVMRLLTYPKLDLATLEAKNKEQRSALYYAEVRGHNNVMAYINTTLDHLKTAKKGGTLTRSNSSWMTLFRRVSVSKTLAAASAAKPGM